jgi:hypothetical protein
MTTIATLVTGKQAVEDFKIFLYSLQLFVSPLPALHIATDDASLPLLTGLTYHGTREYYTIMNRYTGMDRKEMEAKGVFKEYTSEKLRVIELAFVHAKDGVWFFDADICFFGPLPVLPETATVGLSPHYIRKSDTDLYGVYNAGFVWLKDVSWVKVWRDAIPGSRFFEQAALETVASMASSISLSVSEADGKADAASNKNGLYEFDVNHNYGWWRMFQSPHTPAHQKEMFGINRAVGAGITVENLPLGSVHTHFTQRTGITDEFNLFMGRQLSKIEKAHKPAHRLLWYIGSARSINSM